MAGKNIIITGSTGMVGKVVLEEALGHPEVAKVTALVRKPQAIKHPKYEEIVHKDFTSFTGSESIFQGQDIAYFCIGVYTGQVSDDMFKTITVDFVTAFGDMLAAQSPQAGFCLLSGAGADLTEKSRVSFARYKGMAENYLLQKGFPALGIFRPAYIYPVEKRKEPNPAYGIFRFLYPLMKRIFPKSVITSETLGKAIFLGGLRGVPKDILENEEIKALLKEVGS
ncbi:MAG: NAD(P)H-binding protein [Bacteroidota bacterium]